MIAEIERLLRFGVASSYRSALAAALVEGATLAGWQALDRVALRSSWDLHETAVRAAYEAGSVPLLAHAKAQQALVLVDLGEPDTAAAYVGEARALGEGAPALIRAWVCAVDGEVRAAAEDRDGALRAFDEVDQLMPAERRDADFPFLFLADGHLERWRAQVLTAVGDIRAVSELEQALARIPGDFVRARSSTLVDLAFATAAAGERDAALAYAREARRVAGQVASDRQLRRLRRLRLPSSRDRGGNSEVPKRQRSRTVCTRGGRARPRRRSPHHPRDREDRAAGLSRHRHRARHRSGPALTPFQRAGGRESGEPIQHETLAKDWPSVHPPRVWENAARPAQRLVHDYGCP